MKNKKSVLQSIVFTGGGSAGHVVPNMALINALIEQNPEINIHYIGSEKGIERELIKNIPYHTIACGKLRRYFSLQNILDPFKIILGIFQAWCILGSIKPKPQMVFSKGGFVAFPVVFSAWLRRVPVIAHESDLTPGLANRLSFPFVKKIALTFEKTEAYLKPQNALKTVVTGTPIRKSLLNGDAQKGREICAFKTIKPCLLVIGGGSGAAVINASVRRALPELLKTMNVIHCCGQGKQDVSLNDLTDYKQFEYANAELADLYACADLVISRAGANTVYEILALKKSAIFIPLSLKASRGDQVVNARWIASQGLGIVLDEDVLLDDEQSQGTLLQETIKNTWKNRESIQQKIIQENITSGTDAIIYLINTFINSPTNEVIRGQ